MFVCLCVCICVCICTCVSVLAVCVHVRVHMRVCVWMCVCSIVKVDGHGLAPQDREAVGDGGGAARGGRGALSQDPAGRPEQLPGPPRVPASESNTLDNIIISPIHSM